MQKDEEVGKVAQATPIVICLLSPLHSQPWIPLTNICLQCKMILAKALEMFLGLIIEESHKITSNRGSKKVEAYHLYVFMCKFPLLYTKSTLRSPLIKKTRRGDNGDA